MRELFERVLSVLFPPEPFLVEADDALYNYEVSNYPGIDPFRPFGHYDSWAGNIK